MIVIPIIIIFWLKAYAMLDSNKIYNRIYIDVIFVASFLGKLWLVSSSGKKQAFL